MEQQRDGGSARSGRCRERRKARNSSISPLRPSPCSLTPVAPHLRSFSTQHHCPKPSPALSPLLPSKRAVWICAEQFRAALKQCACPVPSYRRRHGEKARGANPAARARDPQTSQDTGGTSGKCLEGKFSRFCRAL